MTGLGNKEVFAKNLKRLMDEKNILRPDLAKILDVSYSTVNDWYNARTYPRIDMIEMMAGYFGVNKAALIEETHRDYSPKKKYLMDRIAKADDKKIDKLNKLMELIDDEEADNW